MNHSFIKANGLTFHVAQKGPEEGELVLLLHGFPEFWYGWRKQIDYLADKGYRVWAPDQRGYSLSDKPENVEGYQLENLVGDVVGLIEASQREKVVLVGHDWGGIVAWRVAREYPELVERLIILNAPHEAAMKKQVLQQPTQLLRSSYALFFQIQELPEKLIQLSDWETATKMLQATSREGTFTEEDLKHYKEAWNQPNAMTSMINWYRANVQALTNPKGPRRVTVPTLIMWGAKDQFLGRELARKSLEYCGNGKLIVFEKATHWIQHEEATRVNRFMWEYMRGNL